MTHDIDDLLQIIKELEERIILLERLNFQQGLVIRESNDDWYWDH